MNKTPSYADQIAALEICSSELYLVVIREPKGGADRWRRNCNNTNWGLSS